MSDSIEMTGCLRHRDNARYFIYYEDLQEISPEHPDKLAAFIRVLEVKTNKRIVAYATLLEEALKNGTPIPSLNLWLEVSYTDFVYWSLGTLGRSSFQTADKVAQKKLLVKSRVLTRPIRPDDPDSPKVPYKEYILVRENAQAAIDKQEAPIQGEDYEKYGETPPVIENIPLLKKTGDMLRETRGGMLEKTRPPVEKNSNLNKVISNGSKESKKKDTNMSSSDDAPSHQSEKDEYEKRITELEERIAYLLQASKDGSYPPEPPKGDASPTTTGRNDTPLTPAGSITSTQEPQFPQSSALPENQEHHVLDNSSSEPPNRQKTGSAETQPINTQPAQDKPSESQRRGQESTSSTQAVNGTSNQATEQGKQANNDDPIASGATKKVRGGRGKSVAAKEEKPQLSDEEKTRESERLEKHRIIYSNIVQRRGGEVDPDKIGLERKFVNKLIERGYTPERVDRFHQFLEEEDWHYCKTVGDKKRITAQVIFNNARTIEMTLDDPNYRPPKKGNQRNSSVSNVCSVAPTSPKASMTHDDACKLAHDAIVQAKQHGYDIQAQAVSSTKVEGAWIVKIKWENTRNLPVPLIKTRKQWEDEFQSMHEVLNMQLSPVGERQAK